MTAQSKFSTVYEKGLFIGNEVLCLVLLSFTNPARSLVTPSTLQMLCMMRKPTPLSHVRSNNVLIMNKKETVQLGVQFELICVNVSMEDAVTN